MFYPNFLLHQLPGIINLLRRATDSEHLDVRIGVGWGIPLQLNPGSRLLTDALDCLTTWRIRTKLKTQYNKPLMKSVPSRGTRQTKQKN